MQFVDNAHSFYGAFALHLYVIPIHFHSHISTKYIRSVISSMSQMRKLRQREGKEWAAERGQALDSAVLGSLLSNHHPGLAWIQQKLQGSNPRLWLYSLPDGCPEAPEHSGTPGHHALTMAHRPFTLPWTCPAEADGAKLGAAGQDVTSFTKHPRSGLPWWRSG